MMRVLLIFVVTNLRGTFTEQQAVSKHAHVIDDSGKDVPNDMQKDLTKLTAVVESIKIDISYIRNMLTEHGQVINETRHDVKKLKEGFDKLGGEVDEIQDKVQRDRKEITKIKSWIALHRTKSTIMPRTTTPPKTTLPPSIFYPRGTTRHEAPRCVVRSTPRKLCFVGYGYQRLSGKGPQKHYHAPTLNECFDHSFMFDNGRKDFGMVYNFFHKNCLVFLVGDVGHVDGEYHLHYRFYNLH